MQIRVAPLVRFAKAVCLGGTLSVSLANNVVAGTVEIFHADSLAGPMRELKKAFESKHAGVKINLTSGVSRQLADRILGGEACDVFAPSSPAVADDMMKKRGTAWYVVFSANEMVIITPKGNPLGIQKASDLAKPGVKFARVTGEQDLGTGRTVEFLKRAADAEGHPELAQKIIDASISDPSKANSVPQTVAAVREGRANAGVVYYSAAVAAKNDIEIIRFPAAVNISEAIRNAAAVPATARNPKEATDFIRFLLSPEGQTILAQAGQPPIVPAIRMGDVPAYVKN
jgi:molybdate transport system substrate-binding protein